VMALYATFLLHVAVPPLSLPYTHADYTSYEPTPIG
jgi:hypothetical protein